MKTYECPLFLQPSQEAIDPTKHFAKEGLDVHAVIRSMPLAFLLRTVKQVVLLGSAVAGAGVAYNEFAPWTLMRDHRWDVHVKRHGPLRERAPGLWQLSEGLRNMVIYKNPATSQLVIHNAICVDDETMEKVLSLGTPAVLIVPNRMHRRVV